ncbi:MAG: rsmH [Planctomycetaceae bacterium]|nr:rsmH [Planctomycetaceae bacterium]
MPIHDDFQPRGAASSAVHVPVLLREVLQYLELQPGQIVVDGTVGAGGHSSQILKRIGPTGKLIGFDRDPYMLSLAAKKLTESTDSNFQLVHASYAQMRERLDELQVDKVDRILLDIGLSSDQLAANDRGFGFHASGPLDLRFDTTQGEPAWKWLEKTDLAQLSQILEDYGEEPFAKRIAEQIISHQGFTPIRTAQDLSQAVESALPTSISQHARRDPATRVFQALRIAVNQELLQLEHALSGVLAQCLVPGGIVVIISFHSLEDRQVKNAFRESALWHNLTPKPVSATPQEQRSNPRSRSAKLRAARRL